MKTRAKTALGFTLACGMVILAMISASLSISEFIDGSQWTLHTVEVLGEIEKLKTMLMSAQNNIRAYHMTEQSYYLKLHQTSKESLSGTIANLRQLIADNKSQQQRLSQIEVLIKAKIERWDKAIQVRKAKGLSAIRASMMSDETKNRDLALLNAIDDLKQEEAGLLAARLEHVRAQGFQAKVVVWGGGLVALLLMVTASFLVYRDRRGRTIAEDNIDRFFTLSLDLLCISGMDGFFKRLSPSFEEVLGYDLRELYTRPILDFVHPDDIERTKKEVESQMKGKVVLSFENRYRCRDGSYRLLSWKSVPVGPYMYAAARDITQQREFERELMETREAAQKATHAKSEFLANMSHEIRTPLNGVIGITDLLSLTALNSEQNGLVSGIRNSARGLLKIVNEVLDFSKIEAGRMTVEHINFDLNRLVEAQVSLIGVLAREKNLRLETVIATDIPDQLHGDAVKIGQILLNFLSNAVKFTMSGKITLRVEIENMSKAACGLKFSVVDTGIGMDGDQVTRLFKPFVQADGSTARKFGGTGLGLSISKRLIEIMHGQVGVESTPNKGSTFWFRLDLGIPEEQPQTAAIVEFTPPSSDKAVLEHRKLTRVLVAEDKAVNQMIIMKMLSVLGYEGHLAKDGLEAVRLFMDSEFDIILMDQHMPRLDGVEASIEIRKMEEGSDRRVPIIAFTATVIQEENKVIYENIMDDVLLKPVTIDALEAVLTKWERRAYSPT